MTAVTSGAPAEVVDGGRARVVDHVAVLARRSMFGLLRQPQTWLPSMIFPLFFAAIGAAAFDRTRQLPGFPEVDSYLSFLLPATLIQGVMFASSSAGVETAIDLENGFFDRLLASPVRRLALLGGNLAGTAALAGFLAVLFSVVMVVFGATIQAGVAGVVVMVVVSVLLGLAIGGMSIAIGLRTASVEAVNGSFPIFFVLIFMSSAFFPPELSGGWFEFVANLNPVTYLVDPTRHLVIVGWSTGEALQAIAVAACFTVIGAVVALTSLRRRLAA